MLTSSAPAKLILAGEHAVLYGSPALTTRLNWQTRCRFLLSENNQLILTDATQTTWTPTSLHAHWGRLNEQHIAWKKNSNTQLLHALADLPLAVFAWWQQHYRLPTFTCQIQSNIPIGQGLGSSASLIIALLRGLSTLTDTPLSLEAYQQAATELENLAHGKSSGLDVAAILTSDRTYWQEGKSQEIPCFPMTGYLVNTGKAQTTTADCVGYVRQHHQNDQPLWRDFSQKTAALHHALMLQITSDIDEIVASLHQNLCLIGVVPKAVQYFADAAKNKGWSGKLCGAGSISGDGGGFFWLLADEDPKTLCDQFGYPYWQLSSLTEPI